MQDKKWKILIADDEIRISMLIKTLVDWDKLGCICVGMADNGETAYQMIHEEKPDIVITDIRMPKCNGLELVQKTKEVYPDIKFVIISGYKEFEYARKALQYGVSHYLLKPIQEAELNKVLHVLVGELKQEHLAIEKLEEIHETVSISRQIIKSNILESIINQEKEHNTKSLEEEYNLDISAESYLGLVLKLDYRNYEAADWKQDEITINKIISVIDDQFEDHVKEKLICEKENLYIFVLLSYAKSEYKNIKDAINALLSEVQEYLIGFEHYEVTIGIGREREEFAQIRESIEEAKGAVDNRIKLGASRLIYAKNLSLDQKLEIDGFLLPFEGRFQEAITTFSRPLLEQVVNDVFAKLQDKENVDYACSYEIARKLIIGFFSRLGAQGPIEDSLRECLLNHVLQCYSFAGLKSLLKKYLGDYLEKCFLAIESEPVKPIKKAMQYIDEHYQEKIGLEELAEIVGLNPVYFSTLFKSETGLNFSAYLIKIRMAAAQQILCNSNETIAAVAAQVGYKDVRYFSQLFSKNVGVKPALYRKLHS
ncbi:MAG: response regulator [Lachnospiraceae bacterium]|nr:response regulator [Lachnospiraceae bacterium]